MPIAEQCAICGCELHRAPGTYARATIAGRSHATKHHVVAERFFGRSATRRGVQRTGVFAECPWDKEGHTEVFCFECHEELLHNPVLLPEDINQLAELVRLRGLNERKKSRTRAAAAGRIQLLHEVIARGLGVLLKEQRSRTRA